MAKLTKESFIESLKEMTLLEIKELVDAMKEEFGVDPSSVAVAAAPAAAEAADEKSTFDVVLTSAGANKIAVIKIVREVTSLGLVEAKNLTEAGGAIKEGLKMATVGNFFDRNLLRLCIRRHIIRCSRRQRC